MMESKEEILKQINDSIKSPMEGRNSMGCSESFYDPYYLIAKALEGKGMEPKQLTEYELQYMLIAAIFATEVFY